MMPLSPGASWLLVGLLWLGGIALALAFVRGAYGKPTPRHPKRDR